MRYRDRRQAGRYLAQQLGKLAAENPVVIALPRGGVPVAYEIAQALAAPLDVLAVRKLGAPSNPEYGVGAVVEDGTLVLDEQASAVVGLTGDVLQQTLEREVTELNRRVREYRDDRPPLNLRDRTVIVVDDGLATGLTDLAAVHALRERGAAKIVLAVPVAPKESLERLASEADEVICPSVPSYFGGVGLWYEDFSPVPDREVIELLTDGAQGSAAADRASTPTSPDEIAIAAEGRTLMANRWLPPAATGLVIFAHGSGSSRHSPRNMQVAEELARAGFASLLMDLLTETESASRSNVFDIGLLAERLTAATRWVSERSELSELPIGYFGASTGAAAALSSAAELGETVRAVVSRGGRPDLAPPDSLAHVTAPTLLIVGSEDHEVAELNRQAAAQLRCPHELATVEGATHLFEEPGALEVVSRLAERWFKRYLAEDRKGRDRP